MNNTAQISAIACAFGAVSLLAATVAVLLQRTQSVPPKLRVYVMARLACLAVWNVLPPKWAVVSVVAGLLAWIGSWLVGVATTVLIVWLILPTMPDLDEAHTVPQPIEAAYEGAGFALMALCGLFIGVSLSFYIAPIIGMKVGKRVASRWS
jgi:hypothetical protein